MRCGDAVDGACTLCRLKQAGDGVKQCSLAGTVLSKEKPGAGADERTDIGERLCACSFVLQCEVVEFDLHYQLIKLVQWCT